MRPASRPDINPVGIIINGGKVRTIWIARSLASGNANLICPSAGETAIPESTVRIESDNIAGFKNFGVDVVIDEEVIPAYYSLLSSAEFFLRLLRLMIYF
jgi:hypothetical protein